MVWVLFRMTFSKCVCCIIENIPSSNALTTKMSEYINFPTGKCCLITKKYEASPGAEEEAWRIKVVIRPNATHVR